MFVLTGLFGELDHLKIETRLIDDKFASVMGELKQLFIMNHNTMNHKTFKIIFEVTL